MNESAPQLNQTPADIENRQMLELAGHVLEVRPEARLNSEGMPRLRFYEANPDGKLARISGARFDELASSQIAADEVDAARTEREQALSQARDAAVNSMAKALRRGKITEHSAGPDYIKATGLSHEDVMRLGFKGFAGLAEAGRERQAEQAERKAQRAELAAKQAAQEERNAAAVAWRAEIDAAKAGRDAAADRIEGISYKQKLENGGELGLKRNPDLAAELRQAAVAQAEAEGHDVSDEKPRYHHVRKPSATQLSEQAKTVEALKNFYTPTAKPIANAEDTNPVDADEWEDHYNELYGAQLAEEGMPIEPVDWQEAAGLTGQAWPDSLPSQRVLRSDRARRSVAAGAALAGTTVAATQLGGNVPATDFNKPWAELTTEERSAVLREQQAALALKRSQHAQTNQPKGVRGFFARSKERYSKMSKTERRNVLVAGIGAVALTSVLAGAAALSLRGETHGDADAVAGKETTSQTGSTEHTIIGGSHLEHKAGGKHKGEPKV
ncbi:hypothetical protein KDA14_01910, partial [Candidatus Saccharibacteria bacterium]|nr:hypothetical protein [Candidatus Saccharibacteria bacterium]